MDDNPEIKEQVKHELSRLIVLLYKWLVTAAMLSIMLLGAYVAIISPSVIGLVRYIALLMMLITVMMLNRHV